MKSKLQEIAEKEDYNGILPRDVAAILLSMNTASMAFTEDELEEYINNLQYGHTIVPILDPTAYMLGSKNLEQNVKAAQIILNFKKDIQDIIGDK